jgi:hypothetical protein
MNYDYQTKLNEINEKISEIKTMQRELMEQILKDHNGGEGGMFGWVNGKNGRFQIESIFMGGDFLDCHEEPMIHADFPAFETDIEFDWLTLDEQHQVLECVIAELREIKQ